MLRGEAPQGVIGCEKRCSSAAECNSTLR